MEKRPPAKAESDVDKMTNVHSGNPLGHSEEGEDSHAGAPAQFFGESFKPLRSEMLV